MKSIKLNLLNYASSLRLRTREEEREVYDPVRKKYIRFTQEEMVRQLFIHFLMEDMGISKGRIAVEKKITTGKLEKRFDLLVFDKNARTLLIVECKSPEVELSQETLDQAGNYNFELRAPFLIVSNGISTYAYAIDFESGSTKELSQFPEII